MDSFPAQDTAQQIPVQQAATFTSSPIQELSQKKSALRKFLNLSSWVILFALLPVTVLIFLSQDSIPGDLFYPVKRSLENVILAAASVNPATRAAFRTDLTETRFKEAQGLVVSKSNVSGLSTFIDEVQSTQLEVTNLKDDTQRIKAEEKLIDKLEEYQNGLSALSAKTEQNIIAYQSQQTLTTIPPTSDPNLPLATPTFTPTPTPTPVKQASSASPEASAPTSAPSPTIAPTVPPQQENTQVAEQKRIAITIKETKTTLEKIKKDLEEKRGGNKNEDIQKSEKSKGGEKQTSDHQ